MSGEEVLVGPVRDHAVTVTLNRPDQMNAVNPALAARMGAVVQQLEADPDVWAVVLTGAGSRAFCAGADLKAVAAGQGDHLSTPDGGFAGFVRATRTKPWIAAVNGFALAGGLEISLACDMIVASDTAAFGLPEVTRGLVASAGGVFRLPQAIPRAIAIELVTTGQRIDAQRAYALGLVNRVVAPDRVLAEAEALAATICANAPIAVRESLAIARVAAGLAPQELWNLSVAARERNKATADFREGPRAFVEKRAPKWQGK